MERKLKLYLVKREVLATSVEKAITAKGHVYSVELAADNDQPMPKRLKTGFKKK